MFYRNLKFLVMGTTVLVWIRLMMGTVQYFAPTLEQFGDNSQVFNHPQTKII